jgi:TolB-like protein
MNKRLHLVCLSLLLLLTGCAANLVSHKSSKVTFIPHPRIAVFPFDNMSGQEQVNTKVTEYFQTMLTAQPNFEIVESGTVYATLRRHRIRSASLITDAQLDSVASELKINYFLSGAVLEYREYDNNYLGKVPQVSFNARMIDCSTKLTVWTGVSNGSGDKGEVVFGLGAIRSSDDLARHMVSESVTRIVGLFPK